MTVPATAVTFAPASPKSGTGVLITVAGRVRPQAKIVVTDDAGKVHAVSPVFSQDNALRVSSEQVTLGLGAGVTEGTFKLAATVKNIQISRTIMDVALGDTEDIDYNASAADVIAAMAYAWQDTADYYEWGEISSAGSGGPLDEDDVAVVFGGALAKRKIEVTADSTGLTGGELSVTEDVAGGADERNVSGMYQFGPLFFVADTYSIDLIATAADDGLGVAIGDSLLNAPVAMVVSA